MSEVPNPPNDFLPQELSQCGQRRYSHSQFVLPNPLVVTSPHLRDQNVNSLEGETSGFVRRINTAELTDEHTDSEVGKVVNSIKAAKASENHVQGQISKDVDFRKALTEIFLFDEGVTVSIIGQQVAIDNHLSVNKLDTPQNIVEASGSRLDIIGKCEFFVKLPVLEEIE